MCDLMDKDVRIKILILFRFHASVGMVIIIIIAVGLLHLHPVQSCSCLQDILISHHQCELCVEWGGAPSV